MSSTALVVKLAADITEVTVFIVETFVVVWYVVFCNSQYFLEDSREFIVGIRLHISYHKH